MRWQKLIGVLNVVRREKAVNFSPLPAIIKNYFLGLLLPRPLPDFLPVVDGNPAPFGSFCGFAMRIASLCVEVFWLTSI